MMSKMYKFAHLSDVHIGAFSNPKLKRLALDAFIKSIDACIERGVDFIVIAGDLFDSNLPDMSIVNDAVKKMREVNERSIKIYTVYGSHDFSPNQSSMIDILESAGLFKKVTHGKMIDNKLYLEFQKDSKTGAKLVGISGMKQGIDRKYFEELDRESLEKEEGFRVFIFHGALSEYKSKDLSAMDSMALSNLPKGFDYYAGGHIHEHSHNNNISGFDNVVYPGALFGADYRDIEMSAKGLERGFYLASFTESIQKVEFVKIAACSYELVEYDVDGKSSMEAQADLQEIISRMEPEGKLVLIKVRGELTSGKTSDIEFSPFARLLEAKGAIYVMMNYNQLTTKEYSSIKVVGESVRDIESKIFKESIGNLKVTSPALKGDSGVSLSANLLDRIKQEKKSNESKVDYEKRMAETGIEILGIQEAMEE
ncbi:MAG: DNA repair exonuclease [Clostridia bacterium]